MATRNTVKNVTLAAGAALAAGLALAPMAQAAQNPFGMTELHSGYAVADKGKEGNCGATKPAKPEGKCGSSKPKPMEPTKMKLKEGNCGEAKCGANR